MSEQAGASGMASGNSEPKPPNNSSTKRKPKRSGKKKRNAKKNDKKIHVTKKTPDQADDAELVVVTKQSEDREIVVVSTPAENIVASEPKTPEPDEEQGGAAVESGVDSTSAENSAVFQPKTPDQDVEKDETTEQAYSEPVDPTEAENSANFEKETTVQGAEKVGDLEQADMFKQAYGLSDSSEQSESCEPLVYCASEDFISSESIDVAQLEPDEVAEQEEKDEGTATDQENANTDTVNPTENTDLMVETKPVEETKPADNATAVKKNRNRKKKNRKNKPVVTPVAVEVRPQPPQSNVSTALEPNTNAPQKAAPSYSAVVMPLEDRQNIPPDSVHGPPDMYYEAGSDQEDEQWNLDDDYYDEDYGGVQDDYCEYNF